MKLSDIAAELGLKVEAGAQGLDAEVTGGYVSDLLSDVIGNCTAGQLWITLQVHDNIVAVATLKELAGIVIINGKQVSANAVEKAEAEGIPILSTQLPAYETAGRLYQLGIGAD
ncbi:serine kinase [bacterium]|nr:serine kinase [bacterium]